MWLLRFYWMKPQSVRKGVRYEQTEKVLLFLSEEVQKNKGQELDEGMSTYCPYDLLDTQIFHSI